MTGSDRPAFARLLLGLAEGMGEPITEARVEIYFRVLQGYDIRQVEGMVQSALRRCRFFPKPADLIEQLDGADGHPGPEEAWAVVAALNEHDTVVWTDPIAVAYGVAEGVLPDRVAARMAFLEAYRREVAQARASGQGPRWRVSLGYDVAGRRAPVEDAVVRRRLSVSEARAALPPASWPPALQPALPPGPAPEGPDVKALVAGLVQKLTADEQAAARARARRVLAEERQSGKTPTRQGG